MAFTASLYGWCPEADLVITLYSTWPRADGNGESHGWGATAELMEAMIAKFR